ncbi:MAG TPA: hypothetical protein VFK50_09705 [Sphingomicrobium sp.]|nr:hypothetical protein [Sphingomicrobium sp.]
MTKLAIAVAGTGLIAGLAALPQPSFAQAGSRVSEIIVYGNDPCPRSTDDEVVVCARKPEAERYRIPENLRSSGPRQTREAWANRARAFETVGATGINSCSPVGPSGFTGCLKQVIDQAEAENKEAAAGATPPED